jgi:PPOX class probable F420-dependent enzyme
VSQEWLDEGFRRLVDGARVARLGTVAPEGHPHVVPVSTVLDGAELAFATESETGKVRNLRAEPRCCLVFDEYSEDWQALRQVVVWGTAVLIDRGPRFERVRTLLYSKFLQYEREAAIEEGQSCIVAVRPDRVSSHGV